MASTASAHAPAKVNLALSVGAPRADGMHEIASWMVTTAFGDDLMLRRLPAGTPSRYAIQWAADARRRTEIDWSVAKDLAVRAHLALETALGRTLPVQMLLEKRIPVGGGLGGGSSNAAAMLRALDALFDLRLRREYLEEVARTLGSDVPFLVRGGSAIVEGLGERLSDATIHETHLVLVFPEAQCPTGRVYRVFDEVRRDARVDAARVRALAGARPAADTPFNDLADAACTVAPILDELRGQIERLVRQPVHVSGSGSTLFLVAYDPFHAEALAGSVEMKLGLPAVSTVTAHVREEHVDGEPRVAVGADDDD
ncbi:MAG: 4-(cytidine 5'-diphospho)-2-C-methyl-D-erythritol kinase [Planctomycetota bacterium]